MSIVAVQGVEYVAPQVMGTGVPFVLTTLVTINTTGYKAAAIFRIPKTGNVHKLGFLAGTLTTPTDTDVRLETVSAQFPTGSLVGTNTNGTILSGALVANAMNMATLTADAAVTAGDLVALVVAPSGSPNYIVQANTLGSFQLPYSAAYTGSWAAAAAGPIGAVEYSDGSYAVCPGLFPITAVNTHTCNSGSTPDEIGAKFKIPVSLRVSGCWLSVDIDNSLDVVLYDTDGVTVLATAALTNAGRRSTNAATPYRLFFATAVTLTANAYYYLSVKPGASNVSIYSIDMLSAAALDQLPGGQDWQYVSAKDPSGTGSWTAITTRYPVIGLLIDGIDSGAGVTYGGGTFGG